MSCGGCGPTNTVEFCLTRGTEETLVFEYDENFNLAAYETALFTAKLRVDTDPTDSSAALTGEGVIDADAHTVTFVFPESATTGLLPGNLYWYDVALIDGGTATIAAGGRFSVSQAVTNRRA